MRADEAEDIELTEPTDQAFEGVEVLLRVTTSGLFGLRDLYIATPPDAAPVRQWETGVRVDDDTP